MTSGAKLAAREAAVMFDRQNSAERGFGVPVVTLRIGAMRVSRMASVPCRPHR